MKSTTNFQSGLFRERAYISQSALFTAPDAMWITPFSGPILSTGAPFNIDINNKSTQDAPPQLGVRHHKVPRLPHVREERLGVLAHEAVRDLFDCDADLRTNA